MTPTVALFLWEVMAMMLFPDQAYCNEQFGETLLFTKETATDPGELTPPTLNISHQAQMNIVRVPVLTDRKRRTVVVQVVVTKALELHVTQIVYLQRTAHKILRFWRMR